MKRLMFLLTAVAAFASVGPHAAAEITEQVVFQRQKDGYNNIRIPVICGKHNRAVAISKDGGETFGELYLDDALQSPVCQASLLRFSWPEDGTSRILFSSPAGRGREEMTIRVSYDEGKTWPVSKEIYSGGAAYSNLVKLSDETVGLLYEKDGYAKVVLATIPLKDLEGGAVVGKTETERTERKRP